ncbi:thioesterase family protein [Aliarcobacter skirrowii]|uniref:thioesterase family protein n=1 Tax=Aliarcobacter skirrowii TaxID=28200 RepID=UPI000D604250|nr:thioesterase [Aliarcobacter skirrowii]PWE23019.1 thioesterase [Aliarcobacter skirrowii]PWE25029.1 thioesterase [Aliarcobacter skirrowii]RJO56332.1 thioesterase [Aliarcobacter skirrowii]RJO58287.1 thioesterase [Aliarcobacter skirrowii]
MSLEIGTKATIEYKVQNKDLASNLQISIDDNFPQVFATARMVALMECSAAKMMKNLLKDGDLSVGVGVDIKHLAPTLENDTAVSTATFVGMEGKLYKFEIEVVDSGGVIGTGVHTRAIVSNERLINGAKKRVGK